MQVTREQLDKYLGKDISKVCGLGFKNSDENHCAHFVSHILGLKFGYVCGRHVGKATEGVCIRVHEVFARCPVVGKWSNLKGQSACLVFITQAGNVSLAQKVMANVPKKHVGIYLNGTIWHYSNKRDQVVTQAPTDFKQHYSGSGFSLFYGTFPT